MGVRNPDKGARCLAEIQGRNPQGTLSLLTLDVTSDASIKAASAKLQQDFGCLDVLINNAGIEIATKFPSREELRTTFETNLFGPVILTQTLIPLIKSSKGRKIINVTSELGSITERVDPDHPTYHTPHTAYRMSKSALNMMTACQYHDWKDLGIKIWSYCPGFVVTDLSGPDRRQMRADMGAGDSKTSAQGIVEITEGKRDGEAGMFIARYGGQPPW